MIEARELFVGAKVLAFKGMVCEVEEIRSKTVFFKEGATGVKFENLEPIPLSEEWLLRAGFKYKPMVGYWHFGTNPTTQDYYVVLCKNPQGFFYKNTGHPIKYVHQLQNLVALLTGQELEFKD